MGFEFCKPNSRCGMFIVYRNRVLIKSKQRFGITLIVYFFDGDIASLKMGYMKWPRPWNEVLVSSTASYLAHSLVVNAIRTLPPPSSVLLCPGHSSNSDCAQSLGINHAYPVSHKKTSPSYAPDHIPFLIIMAPTYTWPMQQNLETKENKNKRVLYEWVKEVEKLHKE